MTVVAVAGEAEAPRAFGRVISPKESGRQGLGMGKKTCLIDD